MPLAPEYEAMFAAAAEQEAPALSDLPPEAGREVYRMMRPLEPDLSVGSAADDIANGVPVRVYRPSQSGPHPVVVFYHGGGWVIGDLDTADAACRDLCESCNVVVVSVDYRLAPEHVYPAAVEDSYQALEWVASSQEALGGNGQIVVAGESAGGNLAAVVALKARDNDGPAIAGQLLLYPVVDSAMDRDSYQRNGDGYLLTTETMRWFWNHYCPEDARTQPDVAPLRAASHADLPPAIVVTAEFDPLCDEGAAYVSAMADAGSSAELMAFDGLVHDFFATARLFACSREAVNAVYARLNALLS